MPRLSALQLPGELGDESTFCAVDRARVFRPGGPEPEPRWTVPQSHREPRDSGKTGRSAAVRSSAVPTDVRRPHPRTARPAPGFGQLA